METTFAVAVGIGFLHTLLGPDHYLPFIVIGRARHWRLGRTLALAMACGVGHVASSVVLGLAGAVLGAGLFELEALEARRGDIAGWSLLLFGLGYTAWGVWRAMRRGPHRHVHLHENGTVHVHPHAHASAAGHGTVGAHGHVHGTDPAPKTAPEPATWKQLTPWVLFLVFVLGPCEPLIPLFFADAVRGDWSHALVVSGGYAVATLAVMAVLVTVSWYGLRRLDLGPLERFSHALAGGVVLLAGFAMVFLGL
jgi:ABC-type nickel/cobalt efflux system permease component RcnA